MLYRMCMDILLTHTTALEALRSARLRWRLERRERCDACVPDDVPTSEELRTLIARTPELARTELPLELLVTRDAPRRRTKLARTHPSPAELPAGSAFEVASGVRCVSPEHLPVVMAPALTDLELVFLLSELLGLYAIAPGHEDGMLQRREPLTTPELLLGHLDTLGSERGTDRVRRTLARACVRSGSPRETKLSMRLGFTRAQGGYGFDVLSMNDPLAVRRVHDAMRPGVRKPDILLRAPSADGRGVAVEYDGKDHNSAEAHTRDAERHTELIALGLDEHIVTAQQYGNLDYMDGLAEIIRDALGIPKPRLTPERAARQRRRRQELFEELELIDGVHWNGRERERARRTGQLSTQIEPGGADDTDWNTVPVDAYGV